MIKSSKKGCNKNFLVVHYSHDKARQSKLS
nr:MAG TPA: hypothetical protein [Caudoviricetes sp.]